MFKRKRNPDYLPKDRIEYILLVSILGLLSTICIGYLLHGGLGNVLSGSADNFYVDINSLGGTCNDNNAGTISSPFCTINKALTVIGPGDTVYLRAGTYPDFRPEFKSGTADAYIHITSHNNESVVIDAGGSANSAIAIRDCSYFKISKLETIGAVGSYAGGVSVARGTHVIIEEIHSHHNLGTNAHGIIVDNTPHTKIRNNVVHDNYMTGIRVAQNPAVIASMPGIEITGNHSYNHLLGGGNGDGIAMTGAGITGAIIRDNIVHDNSDDGIDTWNTSGHLVEWNIAYNHNYNGDGNGIKVGGSTTGGNNIVRYNISYNNKLNGIYANGAGGNKFYNNIAFNNTQYGIADDWRNGSCTPGNCLGEMVNNIGMNNGVANVSATQYVSVAHNNIWFDSATGNAKASYNYVVRNTLADYYAASGNRLDNPNAGALSSLSVNPLFVNAASANFTLQLGSPAIDAGDPSNPAEGTVYGASSDIGVFEFNNSSSSSASSSSNTSTSSSTTSTSSQSSSGTSSSTTSSSTQTSSISSTNSQGQNRYCKADYNINGIVDLPDLSLFAANYKRSPISCSLDLVNNDCYLDVRDLADFSVLYKVPVVCALR